MFNTNPSAPPTPAAPNAPPQPDGIHALLPHTIGSNEPDPNAAPPAAPPEPTAEQQRLAALEQTNQQILAQNQQLMQMLMSQRAAPPVTAPAGPQPLQPFTLEGIPDPVSAPKDFATQLTQRIQQREAQQAQYLTHNITTQVARGAAMDALFNRFSFAHPELAKKGATLQGAATQEFQALGAQGIDFVQVAQQNPDSLVARIAQRMSSELGVQQQPNGQPNVAHVGNVHGAPLTPYSPPTPTQPQPNASRAAGIAGGSGTPTPPRAPAPPMSFIDQLNKARRDSGLV